MIGDDASTAVLQILKELIQISNSIAEGHSRRKSEEKPKRPYIKYGKLKKADFNKMRNEGVSFRHITVPKEQLDDLEKELKELGGTFFVSRISDKNTAVIAVPENQTDLANTVMKTVIEGQLQKQNDSLVIHEGGEMLDERAQRAAQKVFIDHDIPVISFRTNEDKYINIVGKDCEKQYEQAMNEVRDICRELAGSRLTHFELVQSFDKPDKTAEIVTLEEAAAIQNKVPNVRICRDGDNIIAFYDTSRAGEVAKAKDSIEHSHERTDDFIIDIMDNTIHMDVSTLVKDETPDKYFVRIPNTAGKDYMWVNKSECGELFGGKTLSTKLDFTKNYAVFDSEGNSKGERRGDDLARCYNTRNPHANKDTEILSYSSGIERIDLFDSRKKQVISLDIEPASEIKRKLLNIGIEEQTAKDLLKNINEKLSEDKKRIFAYIEEKVDVVYSDIPNIGIYLAQAQLSQLVVGKTAVGNIPQDRGEHCLVTNGDSYAVITPSDAADVKSKLTALGFSEVTVKELADEIMKNTPEKEVNEKIQPERFDSRNIELRNFSFSIADDNILLVSENEDTYKYIDIEKNTDIGSLEKALREHFGVDEITAAEIINTFTNKNMLAPEIEKAIKDEAGKINISSLTENYIRVQNGEKAVIINKNSFDSDKLLSIGITAKTAAVIEKSFGISKKNADKDRPVFSTLSQLKENAHKLYEGIKGLAGKDEPILEEDNNRQVL